MPSSTADFVTGQVKSIPGGVALLAHKRDAAGFVFSRESSQQDDVFVYRRNLVLIGSGIVFVGALAVVGPFYEPTYFWIFIEPLAFGVILLLAAMLAICAKERHPVSTEWINARGTISHRFVRGPHLHQYTFSYKDFLGFHLIETEGEHATRRLLMLIRLGAEGEATTWKEGQESGTPGRKFILAHPSGWFAGLREPTEWLSGQDPQRRTSSTPPRWLRRVIHFSARLMSERDQWIRCEAFDLSRDKWGRRDMEDAIKAIADATQLPAQVLPEFRASAK